MRPPMLNMGDLTVSYPSFVAMTQDQHGIRCRSPGISPLVLSKIAHVVASVNDVVDLQLCETDLSPMQMV